MLIRISCQQKTNARLQTGVSNASTVSRRVKPEAAQRKYANNQSTGPKDQETFEGKVSNAGFGAQIEYNQEPDGFKK